MLAGALHRAGDPEFVRLLERARGLQHALLGDRRMPSLRRTAIGKRAFGPAARPLAAIWIALYGLGAPAPVHAIRHFNDVEESAVQVALEHWGTAPACLGGFRRFVVRDEEMDSAPNAMGRHLGGFASWAPGAARDCNLLMAERSKREGYAAFCTTVTHELGHLIRLDDWHSADPADVMYSQSTRPTPHCRAREHWMLAQSDRLDDRANALQRHCRRRLGGARITHRRRCHRRVKATRTRARALVVAVDEVR